MGAVNALRKLIVDDAIVPLIQGISGRSGILSEQESDYRLEIRNLPAETLIIKCDRFPVTKGAFFINNYSESKRADYVLVSESDKVIMFFELKRSKGSSHPRDVVAQLKGAKCIMDYCTSIADSFLGEQDIFKGYTSKYYKGVFRAPQKQKFGKSERPDNYTPETARILPGRSVIYNWL